MMAPLYKRYVPAKASVPDGSNRPARTEKPITVRTTESKGRKRVRTDDEVAQRKAKKLKSKGAVESNEVVIDQNGLEDEGDSKPGETVSPQQSQGEFAHIKNVKKRHKLEKEARKARKIAEKDGQQSEKGEKLPKPGPSAAITRQDERASDRLDEGQALRMKKNLRDEQDHERIREDDGADGGDDFNKLETASKEGGFRDEAVNQDLRDGDADHDASTTISSQPRKRRHRLEHVLQQSASDSRSLSQQPEEHLQKHSGILGKFQKSTKLGRIIQEQATAPTEQSFEAPQVKELVMPEVEDLPDPDIHAASALPSWLAKPTMVSSKGEVPFETMELPSHTIVHLAKLGFKHALPVQKALIPLLLAPGDQGSQLLPGTAAVAPDVAVSAPTGSGKTIAYLVPIMEALRTSEGSGRLKALVVVPTRELVVQVAAVAESLAKGTNIKVGMATGAGSYRDETSRLMKRDRKYDPERYRRMISYAHSRTHPQNNGTFTHGSDVDHARDNDDFHQQEVSDTIAGLVDHVPVYESAVDILVATPGRLLEHLAKSFGFTLMHLEWLVLDEADRILEQKSDELIHAINEQTSRPQKEDQKDERQRYLGPQRIWGDDQERRVRKVMLSATMTRDISKLVNLHLRRPQFIVVRGDEQSKLDTLGTATVETEERTDDSFEVPPMLSEYSVHTGDGSEKPLYLVEMLRERILPRRIQENGVHSPGQYGDDTSSESEVSDSSSDSDSVSSTSLASDSSSSSESEEEEHSMNGEDPNHSQESEDESHSVHPERAAMLAKTLSRTPNAEPTILIFTSSTESANRLSYLLRALQPDLAPHISTMTRGSSKPNRSHPHSKTTDPVLMISTDRAGRGLDTIGNRPISHVIQYDVPRSATSYVHRAGRTARAGKPGEAWTLFTHSEARWFVNEIVRAKHIKRVDPVEKVKLVGGDSKLREGLVQAVANMREAVFSGRKKNG